MGFGEWTNVSVPEAKALEWTGYSGRVDELGDLRKELRLLQLRLRQPGLPDVCTRTIWDQQGNRREVETVGTIREKITAVQRQIAAIEGLRPGNVEGQYVDAMAFKGVARQYDVHFDIAENLERRIRSADIVFVIVSSFYRFREWVDFEIMVSRDASVPVCAVEAGGEIGRTHSFDYAAVVPMANIEISRALDQLMSDH